jgi:23S rRNA (pseudouridine1915-N3)-methyltransferase
MKIVVLAVGKLRDRQLTALCDDYVARASHHVGVEVVEVDDDKALARRWPTTGETIALEVGGESWSTERFAAYIGDQMLHGGRGITFAIGGADGLPAALVSAREPPPVIVGDDVAAPAGAAGARRTDLSRAHRHPRRAVPSLAAPARSAGVRLLSGDFQRDFRPTVPATSGALMVD